MIFKEFQWENPPTVPDLYEENNEGGVRPLKYLRMSHRGPE